MPAIFDGTAPFVLIDAPCTATGTIRRHPDLPWIKGAADVTGRAAAAYELLESGARNVEAGGLLVFAVCSLETEEGEEQVEAFLAAHPEFSPRSRDAPGCVWSQRMDQRRRRSAHPAQRSCRDWRDGWLLCGSTEKKLTTQCHGPPGVGHPGETGAGRSENTPFQFVPLSPGWPAFAGHDNGA